ncbi:BRO-N domain-containing protein [Methylomagnum ishizawai]|uniref:BRO-N domain-containing protein n=1 Tax=Methylomagnum ishizawai TaxID=1760988 RepID=UPI001C33DC2B|nr:BRO family protein [Methylomagnum ishizawai]BBL75441.1 hypothetical protein MishRS11D_25390 [Methylomagnum ishizawai]
MNALALSFHETQFDVIDRTGQPWLRGSQVATALGYARPDALNKIYERNRDEFTDAMVGNVKLTLSGNLETEVRIFSLRGCHLLAMFARTRIAKEFRKWVLDVLDRLAAEVKSTHTHPVQTEIAFLLPNTRLLVTVEGGRVVHVEVVGEGAVVVDTANEDEITRFLDKHVAPDLLPFAAIHCIARMGKMINRIEAGNQAC